jgi:hypothetical protein
MEITVSKHYKFTATAGPYEQTAVGKFSGFVASGGEPVLRFLVKPWILHQEILASSITSLEEVVDPEAW